MRIVESMYDRRQTTSGKHVRGEIIKEMAKMYQLKKSAKEGEERNSESVRSQISKLLGDQRTKLVAGMFQMVETDSSNILNTHK